MIGPHLRQGRLQKRQLHMYPIDVCHHTLVMIQSSCFIASYMNGLYSIIHGGLYRHRHVEPLTLQALKHSKPYGLCFQPNPNVHITSQLLYPLPVTIKSPDRHQHCFAHIKAGASHSASLTSTSAHESRSTWSSSHPTRPVLAFTS